MGPKLKIPKVSVIIPTYNYGKYIERAIDSVLAQTYQDFEIIVVDDGSTDNTREIIGGKYKDKLKYFYQYNKGAPAARNKGIEESRGDYLVFLDADDWFFPENLKKKVVALDHNQDIGWVYSDWYYVDEEGEIINKASDRLSFCDRKLEGDISSELFSKGNHITMHSVMLRKKCIENVGFFDETLPALQDYEMWLRVSLSFNVKFLETVLSYYLIHQNSISSQTINYSKAFLSIVKKHESIFVQKCGRINLRRQKAYRYNRWGLETLKTGSRKEARSAFFKSIRTFPLQCSVYKQFYSAFFGDSH